MARARLRRTSRLPHGALPLRSRQRSARRPHATSNRLCRSPCVMTHPIMAPRWRSAQGHATCGEVLLLDRARPGDEASSPCAGQCAGARPAMNADRAPAGSAAGSDVVGLTPAALDAARRYAKLRVTCADVPLASLNASRRFAPLLDLVLARCWPLEGVERDRTHPLLLRNPRGLRPTSPARHCVSEDGPRRPRP
jgi:hypothetical protein